MQTKDLQLKRALRSVLFVLLLGIAGMTKLQAQNITFADNHVKDLCVSNWDINHDGELSYGEAAVVTNLGAVFKNASSITSFVELQYFIGLTSIGRLAFYNCYGLTSIEIPNSVTSISEYAFGYCHSLTSIEIPISVTFIGSGAFFACNGLEQIVVDPDNTAYDSRNGCNAIINTSANELVTGCKNTFIPNSVTSIGSDAFAYCYNLTSIEIPNSVTLIGSGAFNGCYGLTSIVIPNSVTSIANGAFSHCHNLTSIEIPNSVTSIGSYAFFYCYGMTSIVIPNSVSSIGDLAFYFCSGLTSIEIPNSVTSIGSYVFEFCSGLEQIVVDPENIVYDSRNSCNAIISTSANELVTGCKNTVIPNSVTSIGDWAFYGCSGLTSIEIPNSVTSIGDCAFGYCNDLEQIVVDSENTVYDSRNSCNAIINTSTNELVTGCKTTIIPNSVTLIGSYAFYYCYSLTSIEIPNSVTSIGSYAFSWCSGLNSMTVLADNPPTLGNNGQDCFYDVNKSIPVYVPSGSLEAYQNASGWNEFTNIQEVCTQSQTINLSQGWNWFSTNVEITLDDLKAALVEALPTSTTITIKSQNGNTTYNGTVWRGQLTSLDKTRMYMIHANTSCEITLQGMPINPTMYPVTIQNGFNWIAFPLSENMSISNVFDGFAVIGDAIKSQNGNAIYTNEGWRGNLNILEIGKGYMYKSNTQEPRTFTFPVSTK